MVEEPPNDAIGLRITVLEGGPPGAPAEFFFPRSQERIVLGRDPAACDVVFAADTRLKGVGNEHLALLRSLGRYQLDLNTDNVVLVDGSPAFEDQEITGRADIRLGTGARVRIEVVDDRLATVIPAGRRQRQVWEIALGTRRLTWSLGLVGTAALAALAVAVPSLRRPGPVPDAVLAEVAKSVYSVVIRGEEGGEWQMGTAWIGPGPRVFTNAHVAEAFEELEPGESLVIRASKTPYEDHAVTGVTIHPGYKKFDEVTRAAHPSIRSTGGRRQSLEFVSACDVAVMEVADAEALAPPLPVADRQTLFRLERGTPLALVGFASEGLLPTQLVKPVPLSPGGVVQRMTDFLMEPNTPEANLLIQHSIPSAGGASGSPVVDSRGRVVGLLSAGNHVSIVTDAWLDTKGTQLPSIRGDGATKPLPTVRFNTARSPHAALLKYAQRADLVHDFLEGNLDRRTEGYVAQWRETLDRLPHGPDVELDVLRTLVAKVVGIGPEPRVEAQTLVIAPPAAGGTQAKAEIRRELGVGHHAVILSSPDWPNFACSAARGRWYLGHATSVDGVAVVEFTLDDVAEITCDVTLEELPRDQIGRDHAVDIRFVTWAVDPRSFATRRAIIDGREQARYLRFTISDEEPTLVHEADQVELDVTEADERTGTEYVSAKFTIPLSDAGIYLVVGRSDVACNLDLAIAGSGRDWWERDESLTDVPWILHRADGTEESLDVVVFAEADRAPGWAKIDVYRWPARVEQPVAGE